jgi:phosphoserine aminotransferase
MNTTEKPLSKPKRPYFSSGPCPKRPGWSAKFIESIAFLGRSHRARHPLKQINEVLSLTKEILKIPKHYRVAIVPGSDTGAFELLMWNLLGRNKTTMLVWESFGNDWATDATEHLKLKNCKIVKSEYGMLPILSQVSEEDDICFTWNGTTSGVRVQNGNWIKKNKDRLVICDATSAVFSQNMDWEKLDAVSFSWQKVLGGEGGHGVIVLSPNAVRRLEDFIPDRPLPKIFRLTKNGKINEGIFKGETINTPSMFCIADALDNLNWIKRIGGLKETMSRSDKNFEWVQDWVDQNEWIENLAKQPNYRSNTSVCLQIVDPIFCKMDKENQLSFVKEMVALLEKEEVAFDVKGHRNAPPGLRIWCGATVELQDLIYLTSWLNWGFHTSISNYK